MIDFVVWCPERGQEMCDGRAIHAYSHKDAAERWAARDDAQSADYLIVGGNPANVLVSETRAPGPPLAFTVHGESTPYYIAQVTGAGEGR